MVVMRNTLVYCACVSPLAAELPPDAEGLEGIEQLLGQVQTTMSQLRQIQVANQA